MYLQLQRFLVHQATFRETGFSSPGSDLVESRRGREELICLHTVVTVQ